jgi:hypothetical protein
MEAELVSMVVKLYVLVWGARPVLGQALADTLGSLLLQGKNVFKLQMAVIAGRYDGTLDRTLRLQPIGPCADFSQLPRRHHRRMRHE